jgi:predicted 3-demethylubiquinone-9 3-methyltransferase (glyoxalase superfamily)
MAAKQKITTCLWFDGQAEEAVKFYGSVFKGSKVLSVVRYGDAGPGPKGTVMAIAFRLEGREFLALNGGPQFKFTEAVSLVVQCETQREVDAYWRKLTAKGGQEGQCGWLKDRYGLSWQVVPSAIIEMLQDPDPERSRRLMEAIFPMRKLNLAALKKAYGRR